MRAPSEKLSKFIVLQCNKLPKLSYVVGKTNDKYVITFGIARTIAAIQK
jgi:hypothetical protein